MRRRVPVAEASRSNSLGGWPGASALQAGDHGLGRRHFSGELGLGESGLPIGVQLIGPYLEDRTTLAFAALAEREFGGFIAAPGFA